MLSSVKKTINRNKKPLHALMATVLISAFAVTGASLLSSGSAAANACSTSNIIGTTSHSVSLPSAGQYHVWVRIQVPNTDNTGNVNGVHVEIDGNQCFIMTTTSSNTVDQWQWINSSATSPASPHVTSSLSSGTHSLKIIGKKDGVKVDKLLLLASSSCMPSNDFTNGEPGENCTTPAPNITFTASPGTVASSSSSTLDWSSTNATSCSAGGDWSGTKATSGSESTGSLSSSRTYTLTCSGPGGTSVQTVKVTVQAPPTLTFSANPASIGPGGSSTLDWSSTNATSCSAGGDWSGTKATSGSESTGNLSSSRTYTLACSGPGGNISRNQTVTVQSPIDPPAVSMYLTGVSVASDASSVIVNDLPGIEWRPSASSVSGIKSLTLQVNGSTVSLSGGGHVFGASSNGDFTLRAVATDNNDRVTTKTLTVHLRHPDFNRNGKVDISDLSHLLREWGDPSTIYDINIDGKIGLYDLSFTLSKWGPY